MNTLQQWQWVGALIARIAVGLLFFLSGAGKLFVRERGAAMRETLHKAGIPGPNLNAIVISLIEFLCGASLTIGFLTPLCSVLLIGVMLGALVTIVLPGVQAKSLFDWLSQVLYLPEVLYLFILIWLFLAGPGKLSVDNFLLSR